MSSKSTRRTNREPKATRTWEVGSLGHLLVHAAATSKVKGKAARVILGVAQDIQRRS